MLNDPGWTHFIRNGPSTLKKLMVEEMQVGGAPAEHVEHWKAPEIVESSLNLKYTALTFKKVFNTNNKRDVLQRLKEVIYIMRPVIEGQTQANVKAVKWYLSLNMIFGNFTSPGVKTDQVFIFMFNCFYVLIHLFQVKLLSL